MSKVKYSPEPYPKTIENNSWLKRMKQIAIGAGLMLLSQIVHIQPGVSAQNYNPFEVGGPITNAKDQVVKGDYSNNKVQRKQQIDQVLYRRMLLNEVDSVISEKQMRKLAKQESNIIADKFPTGPITGDFKVADTLSKLEYDAGAKEFSKYTEEVFESTSMEELQSNLKNAALKIGYKEPVLTATPKAQKQPIQIKIYPDQAKTAPTIGEVKTPPITNKPTETLKQAVAPQVIITRKPEALVSKPSLVPSPVASPETVRPKSIPKVIISPKAEKPKVQAPNQQERESINTKETAQVYKHQPWQDIRTEDQKREKNLWFFNNPNHQPAPETQFEAYKEKFRSLREDALSYNGDGYADFVTDVTYHFITDNNLDEKQVSELVNNKKHDSAHDYLLNYLDVKWQIETKFNLTGSEQPSLEQYKKLILDRQKQDGINSIPDTTKNVLKKLQSKYLQDTYVHTPISDNRTKDEIDRKKWFGLADNENYKPSSEEIYQQKREQYKQLWSNKNNLNDAYIDYVINEVDDYISKYKLTDNQKRALIEADNTNLGEYKYQATASTFQSYLLYKWNAEHSNPDKISKSNITSKTINDNYKNVEYFMKQFNIQ